MVSLLADLLPSWELGLTMRIDMHAEMFRFPEVHKVRNGPPLLDDYYRVSDASETLTYI